MPEFTFSKTVLCHPKVIYASHGWSHDARSIFAFYAPGGAFGLQIHVLIRPRGLASCGNERAPRWPENCKEPVYPI
jgi:hypothetical protein